MHRILIYRNSWHDHYWLADTPARLRGAKHALFQLIDGRGCYDLMPGEFYDTLQAARRGNVRKIESILKIRNGRKDETWSIEDAMVAECTA